MYQVRDLDASIFMVEVNNVSNINKTTCHKSKLIRMKTYEFMFESCLAK